MPLTLSRHVEAFRTFGAGNSGAVTVDWVVLTAALAGLAIVVLVAIGGGVTNLGDAISNDLTLIQAGHQNQ